MRLDQTEHRRIMLRILGDISAHPLLSNNLGFKGGTCCYFLHGLDRFSVDLDFDSLDAQKDDAITARMREILAVYGEVKEDRRLALKYPGSEQSLIVDISTRHDINAKNTYEIRDIVSGVPLKVLCKEDIFAHKLAALTDRSAEKDERDKFVANRDLYDIHFFFSRMWRFNRDIIRLRTGMDAKAYLEHAATFIQDHVDDAHVLEGLGALLDDKKRAWVRENLKREVVRLISIEAAA